MKKVYKLLLAFVLVGSVSKAQLSGVLTVPGTYTSIAAAVSDLNLQGVSGAVTINIAAGYTETAPIGGYSLTATGTLANPITFQKSGAGANPLITAYSGGVGTPATSTQDGVWRLIGSDYIIINGIDISDPNTSNPATMEFGYGLFKASATNGCQNNIIKNCIITLNRDNNASGTAPAVDGSRGIDVVNALAGAHTTPLAITSASGSNSNNKFYSNTIQNCNIGISLIGFADVTPFSFADSGNDIGGSSSVNGNTIINFGGGALSVNPAAAVRTLAQYNVNVSYNVINNNNGSGINHINTLRGIYLNTAVSANATVNNNTLTLNSGTTTAQVSVIENVSGATAANNTITINNNLIANCTNTAATTANWYGIYNNAASSANLNINSNTFTNNATNATSGTSYLIYNTGSVSSLINLNNNNLSFVHTGTVAYSGTLYNIYNSSGTTATTLNITSNNFSSYTHSVTGTGSIYFVYNGSSSYALNLSNNLFNNLTFNHNGGEYFLYNSSSTQYSLSVVSNSITNITRNASAGTMYCYYAGSSSLGTSFQTFSNNLFSNITATVSGSGTFYGFYNSDGASSPYPKKSIFNNTISNVNYNSTGTFYGLYTSYLGDGSTTAGSALYNNLIDNVTFGGSMYLLYLGGTTSPTYPVSAYTNTVSNVTSNGASSTIYANYLSSGTAGLNFFKNKTYNITESGSTGILYGMYVLPTLGNIYNNLLGNLYTPTSTGSNRLNGVYVTGGTNVNMYYNTVYLSGTSTGANFGSNAIYASTSPNLNLRNNIFVNNSTPTGTEFAVAYKRASTTLTTYSSTSNNNLFYAGVPSASNLIFYDGTTSQQTIGTYKALVTPRDASAITENPTFVSTVGSNPNFLNINTTTPTQIESGGAAISGIADDYIGTTRNVSSPDIGAWEGNYTLSGDISAPSFLSSGFTSPACNLTSRTYTLNLTDVSGVASGALSPRVYYNINSGPYTSSQGTLTSGTAINGVWTFSLSYSGSLNDVVYYYTVAQDIATTPNLGANPGAGFSGTSVNSITTPPTTPNTFTLVGTLAGTYSVGATGNFTTLTQAANAYNNSCLSGPVTFVLTDASYSSAETFPIVFNNNPYASSTNSLLIIPAASNNAVISGSAASISTLKFLNSKYITIDGLNTGGSAISVNNANISSSAVIWLASTSAVGPGNNTIGIKNLTISGGASTSGNYGILAGVDGASPSTTSGLDNDNITIQGNKIFNEYYGIYATGTATTSAGSMDNLVIKNNQVGPTVSSALNIGYQGIYLGNANLVSITNNTVSNVQGTNAYEWGLNLNTGVRNATVNLNTINSIKYTGTGGYGGLGIDVNVGLTAGANINIQNNMISDITGDGWSGFTAGAFAGIRVSSSSAVGGINIQNNTIAMNQSTTIAGYNTTCNTAAIYFGSTATNIDLRDNILYSDIQYSTNTGSKTYAIYSAAPSSAFTTINYNDYYTGGTQANLAYIAAASQTNMAAVVSSFGQNANSQNILPVFTGITDLHLIPASNAPLDNTGTPISGITIDIDNQVRNATTPDIGADEFTAPTCTTANAGTLATSSFSVCNGQFVSLTSNSVSTGAGTVYQWLVSGSASGPFTNVTGGSGANSAAYITGSLTTGTLYYELQTTCTSLSLTSVSNIATVAINPIPTASVATVAPICAGQNITFTSTTNIGTTFSWTGPNSFSSTLQNPVIANATSSATGVYTLVVSAANCSATAQTTTVTVNSTNLSISAAPYYFCSSGTTTLTALGNATTYTWSTASNSVSIVQSVSATTVYSVAGTGTSNCLATAFTTITVINPTITGVGAAVCNTTAVGTLSASSFGPISWYSSPSSTVVLGTGNTFTAIAATTTTYYAQANSTNTGSLFTTLVAGNGASGNMFDVTAINAITINSVDMHFSTANITTTVEVWYRVGSFVGFESSNAGWTQAYTTTVVTNGTGVLTPIPGTFAINIPAGQTYGIFVTSVNGSPTTNYTNGTLLGNLYSSNSDMQLFEGKGGGYFSVINSPRVFNGSLHYTKAGCTSAYLPVTLTVTSQPTITLGASSTSVCPNTSVNIGATGATTYTWSTGANGALISVTPTASTIYTVSGSNAPGCSSTASIAITTNTVPNVSVVSSASVLCSGQTASLTAIGASSYAWSTSSTNTVIAVSPTINTTYTVTGTGANSCTNSVAYTQSVTICTGIDANTKNVSNHISVYPNPSNGLITADFNFEGTKEIAITNSVGQLIMVVKSNNTSETIDLGKYAKGIYFVKVMVNETTANYRIIIE